MSRCLDLLGTSLLVKPWRPLNIGSKQWAVLPLSCWSTRVLPLTGVVPSTAGLVRVSGAWLGVRKAMVCMLARLSDRAVTCLSNLAPRRFTVGVISGVSRLVTTLLCRTNRARRLDRRA